MSPNGGAKNGAEGGARKRLIEADLTSNDDASYNITTTDEYALKRQRNNAAVNKTRQKKRQEEIDTQKRVQQLRNENEKLER